MTNPQDATIRNVQAANKKLAKLAAEIKDLKQRVKVLERLVSKIPV